MGRAASEDDLEWGTAPWNGADGAALEAAHDILIAQAPSSLYLSRASDRTVVATAGAHVRTLATLEAPARGMALAAGALWVSVGHSVQRIPVAAGAPAVVATGFARPGALALAGRWLFVVDVDTGGSGLTRTSSIVAFLATGSGERRTVSHADGEVTSIAVDEVNLYWADRLEGTIVSAPVGGGDAHVLAVDRGLPGDIAADDSDLYWVEKRSESLWTMPKAGGTPRRLAQDFAGFANLLVYSGGLAWTNEAAVDGAFQVLAVPKSGGDVRAVSRAVDAIDAIATDGTRLFWDRGGVVSQADDGSTAAPSEPMHPQ
jgi:hypothetical protein